MNAITVVDENWAIGKEGNLLVHLPGDLKYYREKTIGKAIVIGRKTLESFPGGKPLPGRTNIVLTRSRDFAMEGCVVCHSKEEVLQKVASLDPAEVFIAGGGQIYEMFLQECQEFYVTRISAHFEADTFFPNLDEMGLQVVWESPLQQEKGISYRFLRYSRG